LGGVTFKNLAVSETLSDDNLLGMNVLGSFGTFEFNEEHQTLSLK
jgi:predicted aspartyl protease